MTCVPFLFLIPLLPLLGFLFNFTVGVRVPGRRARGRPRRGHHAAHGPNPLIGLVACGAVLLSFLVAVYAVLQAQPAPDHTLVETLWTWIPGGAAETAAAGGAVLSVDWAYQVDPLSSVMILVVTFVGFLIHVYSIGYMAPRPGLRPLHGVPEPLHVRDAHAGAGRELPGPVRRAGRASGSARTC